MKLINKFKSPNYGTRKSKTILFVIIHYTALKDCNEAITYLCNSKNKVSSHFLISQNGDIFNLVNEKKRAWHAGQSYWNGYTDLNSLSIGIELDFSNFTLNNKFSEKMILSLKKLLMYLKKKYKILPTNVLGHSDISPFRKIDPGAKFPWHKLASGDLVFIPQNKNFFQRTIIIKWFKKHNFNSKKKIAIFILTYIGYDTLEVNKNTKKYKKLIKSYQMHYLQNSVSGSICIKTYNYLIKHFVSFVLTEK